VSEAGRLIISGLSLLALFTALGIGPATVWGRVPAAFALAPVTGLALASCLTTTAILVMPMEIAAWALLAPLALASVALAALAGRRRRPNGWEIAVPASLGVLGLVLGVLPGLLRGTAGPFSLAITDVWLYIPHSLWLRDHVSWDGLSAGAERYDLQSVMGHSWAEVHGRIGVDAINAAASGLLRTGPDLTVMPLLAALFALVPLSIWAAARALGAGRGAALAGAIFGLSPAALAMVGDGALGNLAALVLAPPALLFLARAVVGGERGAIGLAALHWGGLLAVFPEFVPPMVAAAALCGIVLLARLRAGRLLTGFRLRTTAARLGLVVAGTLLLAPNATVRMVAQLLTLGQDAPIALQLPPRFLTLGNVGAWAFGLVHIYELPWFEQLPSGRRALAEGLPVVLGGLVLLGAIRRAPRNLVLVLAPVAAAVLFGFAAYRHYARGHCEYCLWKSLTLILPFLGIGVALGVHHSLTLVRSRAARVLVGAVLALAAGSVALADGKLTRAVYRTNAFVPASMRDLRDAVSSLPRPASVLIEGADSTWFQPTFFLPSVYYETRGIQGVSVSFDAPPETTLLLTPVRWPEPSGFRDTRRFYTSGYDYVVSPFNGVSSNRLLIARGGPVSLYRRAPIDVVISRTGWSLDPADAERRLPWVGQPFVLRISSPSARRAALTVRLTRPAGGRSTLEFERRGERLPATAPAPDRLCVDVVLARGQTEVSVRPRFEKLLVPPIRANFEAPLPRRPRLIGIRAVHAVPGRCPARGTL